MLLFLVLLPGLLTRNPRNIPSSWFTAEIMQSYFSPSTVTSGMAKTSMEMERIGASGIAK